MGRHSAPPSGDSVADRRPLYLGVAVALVVLVLAVAGLGYALRGNGDEGTTTADSPGTTGTSTRSSPPASESATTTASPSASTSPPAASTTSAPPATKAPRPPTLRLRFVGTSYVRVRSGGRTIFEKVLRKGQTRTFDQRSLNALIGNAAAVRATVNGKPRKPGRAGQVQVIVARR